MEITIGRIASTVQGSDIVVGQSLMYIRPLFGLELIQCAFDSTKNDQN